ncbi:9871_t:CDS:1, partial [Gigaspora rosea]
VLWLRWLVDIDRVVISGVGAYVFSFSFSLIVVCILIMSISAFTGGCQLL